MAFVFEFSHSYSFGDALSLGDEGWGVWSLQTALGIIPDGRFDRSEATAVQEFQQDHQDDGVGPVDGIAGPRTKRALAVVNMRVHAREAKLLDGLGLGIVSGECGFACDAKSPSYKILPGGGVSYDLERPGVLAADLSIVMLQTPLEDRAKVLQHIDVPHALHTLYLSDERGMRPRFGRYFNAGWVKRQSQRELWAWWCACDSWNSPSWADELAADGPGGLSSGQRDRMNHYVHTKATFGKARALRNLSV